MKALKLADIGSFKIWFGWGFPPILLGAVVIGGHEGKAGGVRARGLGHCAGLILPR